MKKFIIKILLLISPIAVLAVSMECLLRQIPNDYKYKKDYLDKHSGEIQVLILGSSDAFFGINPLYFTQKTFNGCHVSQTLDLDLKIFKMYENKFNDLKVIILPISYFTLWGKLEEGVESWRIKNYAIYYGLDTESRLDNSELLNGKLRINIQRLYKYIFEKKDDISCSKLGWVATYGSENMDDLEKTGKHTASYHSINTIYSEENLKIYNENIMILNSFAEICNHRNLKLILLTLPTYRTYRENLNVEQLNLMFETISNFENEHNNCLYINLLDDPDFIAKDFSDANHLSEIGAKKLSEKLIQYIDTLMRGESFGN